ncbi:conserved hypothetical protein [Methylobacillus flagellatus KT]|uniref:Uncharacterized protein n=2 Tax=Methylophilaceae TaxID=32011 RepID=Q1H2I1_METFK|nr:conserved hypothetical protein [Methylobacillus flagellatus KT]ABE49306.1 conserved hypothetical protein [Methylobacillus flagellatus KT]MPS48125.1 hypothetical protein [Methylobacillus sp.]
MNAQTLMQLLLEVEREDPIDFSGLPFDVDDLRRLACLNVVEIMQQLRAGNSAEDGEMVMAATVTRLVLENMVLQARLAILLQQEGE